MSPEHKEFFLELVPFFFEESNCFQWEFDKDYTFIDRPMGRTAPCRVNLHGVEDIYLMLFLFNRGTRFEIQAGIERQRERILHQKLSINPCNKGMEDILQSVAKDITKKMLYKAIIEQNAKFARWEAEYQESKRQLEEKVND